MNSLNRTLTALCAAGLPCGAFASGIQVGQQLAQGGAAIAVTLGLSVLFLAVTLERLLNLRARRLVPDALMPRVRSLWSGQHFAELERMLTEDGSALARVLGSVVAHRQQPYAVVSAVAGDVASMELREHQQRAYALAIVATVAPIVGLLGTVLGMIDAFHVIAYSDGMGNPALLASGISKALVNTAAGLTVALPALGMHHFFKHRLARLGLSLERQVNALINEQFLLPLSAGAITQVPDAR